jgi:low affinity Fe/Cu permease
MKSLFHRFAVATAAVSGSAWSFGVAVGVVLFWAILGPANHYSDTWQLVINTGTTVVTFLMVFLIQNTQNRDSHVMHLKLDELIRAVSGARNSLVAMEQMSDTELMKLEREFEHLRDTAARHRGARRRVKETPSAE